MERTSTYEPNQKLKISFFKSLIEVVKNVHRSRELIIVLFKRDFFSQYKKSFLGIGWILISPIIGVVSWIFMNQAGILNPGETTVPFPVYVLIGSMLWGLFIGMYNAAASTLGAGAEFIMQVKYPHEVLLFKQIALTIINFLIALVFNLVVFIVFEVTPSPSILLLPLLVLPMFFLAAAMGLIMSMLSVVASDLTNAFNILLGFVFYATPIIYSKESKNEILQTVIEWNPLTYIIAGVRDLILTGNLYHPERFLIISAVTLILFLLSIRIFYIAEEKVIEKMI